MLKANFNSIAYIEDPDTHKEEKPREERESAPSELCQRSSVEEQSWRGQVRVMPKGQAGEKEDGIPGQKGLGCVRG